MSKNHIAKKCQSQDYNRLIDFPNLTVGQNLAKVVPNSIFCFILMLNKNDHLENVFNMLILFVPANISHLSKSLQY